MDVRDFIREITAAWNLVQRCGIGKSFINSQSLGVNAQFNAVALDSERSYEEVYRAGLSLSHYNFMLIDYAFFQFSHQGNDSWRLVYYPNPAISGVRSALRELEAIEQAEQSGALTESEADELIASLPTRSDIPVVRFDLAPQQYKEALHPAAHFHIGHHADNRWPCANKIGPRAFSALLIRTYYSEYWERFSRFYDSSISRDNCIDEEFSRILQENNSVSPFSLFERQILHFGRNISQG